MIKKLSVTYCGWQERINKPPILLVNMPNHSTVSYDPEIHYLSESQKELTYDNENRLKSHDNQRH